MQNLRQLLKLPLFNINHQTTRYRERNKKGCIILYS
ncbi:CLUMA_CG003650, isoform A [Clunio marinus]|uniref:CLUMA_CG003650, isoform A n=1 Tax=Clunio marinus TaxID=568069 RepID=A0A1J1HPE5_9DIPT|nr:CLUMA_CG003650, isoform A [Clunio marinus]